MNGPTGFEDLFRTLSEAIAALRRAGPQWKAASEAAGFTYGRARQTAESMVDVMAHELANELELSIAGLSGLVERIALAERFSLFSEDEFEAIVRDGWSVQLMESLQRSHPEVKAAELSRLAKDLIAAAKKLPPLPT